MQKHSRKKGAGYYLFCAYVSVFIMAIMVLGAFDIAVPNEIAFINKTSVAENIDFDAEADETASNESGVSALVETRNATAKIGALPVKDLSARVYSEAKLVPCGGIFGIKFFTKGVIIVGTSEIETAQGIINPAEKAGLKSGDILEAINAREVNTVERVAQILEESKGEAVVLSVERNGERFETSLLPALSLNDNKYKSGLWIRDSTAGIGTVTYYNPQNGSFAGLGHGICDIDTGRLMPLLRASVVDVTLTDIIKGEKGIPGELKGEFGTIRKGSIYSNTELGVYGFFDEPVPCADTEPMEIALSDEVKEGTAEIYATVGTDGIKKYGIHITKLFKNDGSNKSFIFEVTDKALIEKTGGIVRGMSGAPIIQNGKLIGAITHVMVNDPKKGYGIYIENMLSEVDN